MRRRNSLVGLAVAVLAVVSIQWLREGRLTVWWGKQASPPESRQNEAGAAAESGTTPDRLIPADKGLTLPATYRSLGSFKVDPLAQGGRFLITGQIFSEGEQLIPGGTVTLYGSRDRRTLEFAQLLSSSRSDRHGFYEMRIDFPMEGWITVRSHGFAQVEEDISLNEPGIVSKNFTLPSVLGEIRGRVVDGISGLPVANADVFVSFGFPGVLTSGSLEKNPGREFFGQAARSKVSPQYIRSGPSGDFTIRELAQGQFHLTASYPGYFEDVRTVSISRAEHEEVELRVVRGETASLVIKNTRGEPVAHAHVLRPDHLIAKADTRGTVAFPVHPNPKPFPIEVSAEGYLMKKEVVDPKTLPKDILLEEGPLFSGLVVSREGKPVKGARISIFARGTVKEQWEKTITTDESGRFETRLSRPPIRRIHISRSGYIAEQVGFDDGTMPQDLKVVLRAGDGAVVGQVRDPAGKPVRTFSVLLGEPVEWPQQGRFLTGSYDSPSGNFALFDLPEGRFTLTVTSGSPFSTLRQSIRGVEIRKGMIADVGILQLEEHRVHPPPRPPTGNPRNTTTKEGSIPVAVGEKIR